MQLQCNASDQISKASRQLLVITLLPGLQVQKITFGKHTIKSAPVYCGHQMLCFFFRAGVEY